MWVLAWLVVIALVAQVVAVATFDGRVRSSMSQLGRDGDCAREPPDIDALPGLVAAFALRNGAQTKSVCAVVHLRQAAEMRLAPDKPWTKITAEQVISLRDPGFIWYAEQRRGPFLFFRVIDSYVRGKGALTVRLLGSIPVATLEGAQADRSELMRYLAEIAWSPDAILQNSSLQWQAVGARKVSVSAASGEFIATVVLRFDESGDIVEMSAGERGRADGDRIIPTPWRGYFSGYREIGGRRVPGRGEVGWVIDGEYRAYWRGEIVDYELQPE